MTGTDFVPYRSTNTFLHQDFQILIQFIISKKSEADKIYSLKISNAHFEASKNQLIYNLNTLYNLKLC